VPAIAITKALAAAALLMSYGASFPDLYRRAATYVDKVLRGTKPAPGWEGIVSLTMMP
jgi:putative ABC transport system substrate-binding protein